MIGLRRPLGSLAFAVLAAAVCAQDVQGTFQEGVEHLNRGQAAEALAAFQRVLAADPSHADAYELWQSTEHTIWLRMLAEGGQMELVAKDLMARASAGRKAKSNDLDAIRERVAKLGTADVVERARVIRELASEHGEFAVPLLVHGLADASDGDRRVVVMHALTRMGDDVVPPLVEALDSDDALMRRNVALTLGYIRDPRAAGALAARAATDTDPSAQAAAAEAASKCGGGDALALLLKLGDDYHNARPGALLPHQVSSVVWSWDGQSLAAREVPAWLYADEMAKMAFARALRHAPGSKEALAGLACTCASAAARIAQHGAAGQDVSAWQGAVEWDQLALHLAGASALDLALGWALEQGDESAAIGLCRALAGAATQPAVNLTPALSARSGGAVRGEAAVAMAHIAARTRAAASREVVQALAEAAGREVLLLAAIVDGDSARSGAWVEALASKGVHANVWTTGARALAGLRSTAGVDVVFVAETLPDLTAHQVIDEIRRDARLSSAPVFVLAVDPERASEAFGEKAQGILAAGGDMAAVDEALAAGHNPERSSALALAASAARALAHLALLMDVSPAADALSSTLTGRPDEVVLPALKALSHCGSPAHAGAAAALLADTSRSEEARLGAAHALAGILGRSAKADDETIDVLRGVVSSDAPFAVRAATANALGRVDLAQDLRAELVQGMRAR
jgi:CheY-like chemotaxis protein